MRRVTIFGGLTVGLFGVLMAIELIGESEPVTVLSLSGDILETALLVLAIGCATFFSVEFRELRRDHSVVRADLAKATLNGERWRKEAQAHLEGLGAAIQQQFSEWRLSEAESDIAALMMKGFSHKEIAGLRNSTAATVRHQAQAIYSKGLANRAELAAYFLEDLLPPRQTIANTNLHEVGS